MKNTFEVKSESEWSRKDKDPKEWQWVCSTILYPISLSITLLGSMLMKIGNVLMFDTHHLEIKLTPKGYEEDTN